MEEVPDPPIGPRERAVLATGLDALGGVSDAPLRLRGHGRGARHAIFDLQEEFELGPRGRRFILSVDAGAREAVLVPMGPGDVR